MTAINFPDSPQVNEEFTAGTRTWKWNGSVWETVRSISSGGSGGTGATGPQGPTGPQGEGFDFKYGWYSTGSYITNDVVSYNGSTYIYIASSTGVTAAPNESSAWALFTSKGETGAQGPTGPAGSGSGGGSLTVEQVAASSGFTSASYAEITQLQFDEDSGFAVTNPYPGVARVAMNSTFKYWQVNGVQKLTAEGLDTVNFVAGEGITIAANGSSSPQSITITSSAAASAASIHPFALIG